MSNIVTPDGKPANNTVGNTMRGLAARCTSLELAVGKLAHDLNTAYQEIRIQAMIIEKALGKLDLDVKDIIELVQADLQSADASTPAEASSEAE